MVKRASQERKAVPVGVKVVAILSYLFSTLSIFLALVFFFSPSFFSETLLENVTVSDAALANLLFIAVTSFINLGIVGLFIGAGLWQGRTWARNMTLAFSATGILFGIWDISQGNPGTGTFEILYGLLVSLYLLLNARAKAAFIFNERR